MIAPTPSLLSPPLPHGSRKRSDWRAPASASAFALAVASAARAHPGLVIVATRDTHAAHALEAELRIFAGELPVLHFPDWETLPYDLFSPHADIVSQRVATLYRLPAVRRGVLVVPIATLMQRLAPPEFVAGQALVVEVGQRLDLEREKRRLEASGYRNVPQVLDPGDFAVRGALLDLYPMGAAEPYRIELLDEDIDSIRSFDPDTQRSLHKVDSVRMLPAREFPLDESAARAFRNLLRERFPIDPRRCPLYQDLKEGTAPAGIEYYLPLFFERTATLFDYFADDALCVLGEGAPGAAEAFWAQTGERYEQRRHDVERPVLAPSELFLPPDTLREQLNRVGRVEVLAREHPRWAEAHALGDQPAPSLPLAQKGDDNGAALRGFLASYPGRVLVAADSPGRREALLEALAALTLRPEPVADWNAFLAGAGDRYAITVAPLEDGFASSSPALCVLTERQFYPERAAQVRRRKRAGREPEAIIKDLSEISLGAPIVHEDHGVGRYRGL
jgi:transcription-repair coupling factor (superfamily II helicase)